MNQKMPPNMAQMSAPQEPQPEEAMAPPAEEGMSEEDGFLAEGERGIKAIHAALYGNEATSDQFVSMIDPNKSADTVSRAAILLVTEIDKKIDLDEEILAGMAVMAVGELMELAEAAHNIQFSEPEQKKIVMATFEGILEAYDVDPQAAADFVGQVGPEAEKQGIADYQEALNA